MKNTKGNLKNFIHFDTTKTYMCPMIREDSVYPNEIEEIVEVKLVEVKNGYDIISLKPGYKSKYFYDKYLDWLFYTNYIKEV